MMRTKALDSRASKLSDRPLRPGEIDEDTEVVGIIDTCKLCNRTFTAKRLDEVFCPECERKSQDRKEKFHKDNQFGLGVRLGPRAMTPRKIGGTWSGGGIERWGAEQFDEYKNLTKLLERGDEPADLLGKRIQGRQVA